MTGRGSKTTMGGSNGKFRTTFWSEIQGVKTLDKDKRRIIIDNLLKKYWKPVYCYLRRRGYDNESAKDLTQGFFHEIVLGHNLINQADQTKGRFRTFLLTALDRYITNVYRRDTAQKRTPKNPMVRLEPANLPALPAEHAEAEPEQIFNYIWASNLLDEVLSEVKDEYCSTDKANHWEIFNAKIVIPIFENTKPPSLAEICKKYEIKRQSQVSNMIVTVKRRFRKALRRHMRQFVQSDLEIEEEFRDLHKILSQK
jgi:DNA-directed RNA polymerase specialized sigma24 family protein